VLPSLREPPVRLCPWLNPRASDSSS
jgi:hypothetical protein